MTSQDPAFPDSKIFPRRLFVQNKKIKSYFKLNIWDAGTKEKLTSLSGLPIRPEEIKKAETQTNSQEKILSDAFHTCSAGLLAIKVDNMVVFLTMGYH